MRSPTFAVEGVPSLNSAPPTRPYAPHCSEFLYTEPILAVLDLLGYGLSEAWTKTKSGASALFLRERRLSHATTTQDSPSHVDFNTLIPRPRNVT